MQDVLTRPPTMVTPPYKIMELSAGLGRRWFVPIFSGAILIAALLQLRHLHLTALVGLLPKTPLFWLVFAVSYLFTAAAEWMIFRRLWRLPGRGFVALLRKRLSNEILLGYSGEVYFYGWARRNARLIAAPFGAVKDVAILSAAVANIVTLLLVAISWPLLRDLRLGPPGDGLLLSAVIVAIGSFAPLAFGRLIFSLPRRDLGFVSLVHGVRVAATLLLTAMLWMIVMPSAPLALWLILATLRMAVSRLPLLPNKDIVFAGLTAFLMGREAPVASMVSMIAGLTLATHLILGIVLGAAELTHGESRR